MEQFEIKPLIPLHIGEADVSFTNSSLFMVLAVVLAVSLMGFCLRKRTIIPSISQSIPEVLYEFIAGLVRENVGLEGMKYFAFIFTLFTFVAFGNVLGLFPYAFTFTSHLAAVGGLSLIALLFNIAIGIKKKKLGYLRTFLPKGIPFSLTVRLVANMTVGHIMLKIIAGFVLALGIGGIVPLAFDAAIVVFEIFIALLQAFIYTVLSCIYLGDALHEH